MFLHKVRISTICNKAKKSSRRFEKPHLFGETKIIDILFLFLYSISVVKAFIGIALYNASHVVTQNQQHCESHREKLGHFG